MNNNYRIKRVDIIKRDGEVLKNDVPLSMDLADIYYTYTGEDGEEYTRSLKDILFGNVKEGQYKGHYEVDFNQTSLWSFMRDYQTVLQARIEQLYDYWTDLPKEEFESDAMGKYIATSYDIGRISFYKEDES